MAKSTESILDDFSPFQTSLGGYANMIRIPLGSDRGWAELHSDGRIELYSMGDLENPVFQFTAHDGELLIHLGKELSSMVEAYEEYLREQGIPSGETEDEDDEEEEGEEGQGATIPMPPARKVAATHPRSVLEVSTTPGRQLSLSTAAGAD